MLNFGLKSKSIAFKAHKSITSIDEIVDHHLLSYGNRPAIRFDTGKNYESISFDEYQRYVKAMIAFLQNEGAENKIVSTLCKNRIEWDMTTLGTFYTGNIIFPLDTETNTLELKHLFKLCKPDYTIVSYAQLERFRDISRRLKFTTKIIVADLIPVFEDLEVERLQLVSGEFTMSQIVEQFSDFYIEAPSSLLKDTDTILGHYATPGTVNLPKIVRISHGNIIAEVNCAIDVLNLRPNEDLLSIGPYTHIATLVEFLVTKTSGFTVTYFTRDPEEDNVLEDEIEKLRKQEVRIKALMAVPKFWIHLMKEVLEDMKNKAVLHNLYKHLISIEKHDNLHDIGTIEKAKLTAIRILLRNKLGGYFSYGISSSMKLDGAIVKIFGKLGITVIDIYGATESCGIISRNKLNDITPGSCGRLIKEIEYKFSNLQRVPGIPEKVGVLKIKGPTIAHSYIHTESEVGPLLKDEDGYYYTGDMVYIDSDRKLFFVGREEELICWKDGTYIDPQHISNLLVRNIFVKDAMVTHRNPGDDFLSVYLFPDYKCIKRDPVWRKEIDTGVSNDEALKSRMIDAIHYAESIAGITLRLNKEKIYILTRKLERTPTHKIKFAFELKRLHEARVI